MSRIEEFDLSKFGDYLEEFPKSKIPSGESRKKGTFNFYVCSSRISKLDRYIMSKESILLSTGGEAAVHFAKGKYAYSTDVWSFKTKSGLMNSYAYRFLEYKINQINYLGFQGSGIKHLDKKFIKDYQFYIPPIHEQQKISLVQDLIDDSINKFCEKELKLENLKKALINEFLTYGIDNKKGVLKSEIGIIPKDWKIFSLLEISNRKKDPHSFAGGPFGSNLKKEHYTKTGIRIVQLQNIGDGEFLNNYKIFTTKQKAEQLRSCNIFPKDIIISKMGDPVARCCIMPDLESRYLMSSDGIRLSINRDKFDNDFILHSINHHRFRRHAEKLSIGSTRKRISLKELRYFKIACPTINEQVNFSKYINQINFNIKKIKKKIDKLKKIKRSILQNLFNDYSKIYKKN
jgi:type I restriction enzyme, S subunit